MCKQLQIESYLLSKSKSLRNYNKQLFQKSITYCLLLILNVHDYKKNLYLILIIKIKQHDFIFEKLYMNKYEVVFDMFKNKILFLFKRYDHDDNKISTLKDLSFLSITSFIIITRSFKLIIKNDSNENSFDINYSKNVSNKKELTNRKRSISTLKAFKENKIQKFNLIDIAEINAFAYYYLIKNKENKFFSLIMNEIYDTFI